VQYFARYNVDVLMLGDDAEPGQDELVMARVEFQAQAAWYVVLLGRDLI
jgi:hypothetical protein